MAKAMVRAEHDFAGNAAGKQLEFKEGDIFTECTVESADW